jgi:hypothetical protein
MVPFHADTDDSIPMTFEDVEDVNLAADFYMFTSQVDGEQDILEEPAGVAKKNNPAMLAAPPHQAALNGLTTSCAINGTAYTLASLIKVEPATSRPAASVNGDTAVQQQQLSLGLTVSNSSGDTDNEVFFSCDMCNAKLKNKRNFETHMKRHRGELPFKCDECPKTFQGRRDLDTHKRSRHDPAKRGRMDMDMSLVTSKVESVVCPPSPFVFSSADIPKSVGISMNGLTEGLMSGRTMCGKRSRFKNFNTKTLEQKLGKFISVFLSEIVPLCSQQIGLVQYFQILTSIGH